MRDPNQTDQCMQIAHKVGVKRALRAPHCPLNSHCQWTLRCMMCRHGAALIASDCDPHKGPSVNMLLQPYVSVNLREACLEDVYMMGVHEVSYPVVSVTCIEP